LDLSPLVFESAVAAVSQVTEAAQEEAVAVRKFAAGPAKLDPTRLEAQAVVRVLAARSAAASYYPEFRAAFLRSFPPVERPKS